MSKLLIKNASLVLLDRILKDHSVLCEDGKITQLAPDQDLAQSDASELIDAKGNHLAPGLIDLHIHGLHSNRIDHGPDRLANICNLLPQYGVTGFLPTVCPLPEGKLAQFLSRLAKVQSDGAEILGFHLEGPFLTLTGALPPDALGKTDPQRVKNLIQAAKPYKTIFSIAPDFEQISELIPLMATNKTPVFITHTMANVAQTQAAIALGAKHATHFYDVFPHPEVADPGVRPCGAAEAILADPDVSVDFILDGEHVDPIAVKLALQCKSIDKVCLITDSNVGAGLPPGKYSSFADAEIEFHYQGGPARMTENSHHPGCLAGSGLTMDLAVKNALKMLNIDLPQAVRMASTNPANVLGLQNKGQIREGFDADFFLMDNNHQVLQTWVAGKCRYKN